MSIPHPSRATAFEWDSDEHERGNTAKLAARAIRPQDVHAVFLGRPQWQRGRSRGTARWFMVGRDLGGRLLKIGVVWADEEERVLRAITGWSIGK